MKKAKWLLFFLVIPVFLLSSCKKQTAGPAPVKKDSALINLGHLNDLYTPLVFPSGTQAAGVFI